MKRFLTLSAAAVVSAACGGPSNVTGEVVPIAKICGYEKWKTVAVEGYLAPASIDCERASRKRTAGIVWCTFNVYAEQSLAGPTVKVTIGTDKWMSRRHNLLDLGERSEPMKIYDNEGNEIPAGSKMRFFGTLPKADRCELGLVPRIDRVS
jgi:hypothetical protein